MTKYITCVLGLFLILLIAFGGCDDRGRNLPPAVSVPENGVNPENHVFSTSQVEDEPNLLFQIRNPFGILFMETFIPRQSLGEPKPIPTLILLAPENGRDSYYFEHGLFQLAQEMIASGEIQPMMIVCVGNDQTFGGYFYGNSYGAGFYDRVLGPEMVDYLSNFYPWFINSPDKMGIGGIGEGAYGAFRAAIQNPGIYGSITAADGPLDFDGPGGGGGLIPLIDSVRLNEQPNLDPQYFKNSPTAPNNPGFDTASTNPISRMFVGGSIAFSPHDTNLTYSLTFPNPSTISLTVLSRDQISDSTTLMPNIIDQQNYNLHFHLPFDSTFTLYQPTWNRWLANDLERLHNASPTPQPLANVDIWLATTDQARWGFDDMTVSWMRTLRGLGYVVEDYPYEGYEGNPAEGGEYVYDLLRQMLLFHNEAFGGN
jgi:hypothetical protein